VKNAAAARFHLDQTAGLELSELLEERRAQIDKVLHTLPRAPGEKK
jgi:hypothetical protein